MKKSFLKWSTCIAGMFLAFSLTSCVSERDETPEVPTGDGTLVININSTPVGTRTTTLNTDQSTDEKKVSNLVVNIYTADGTALVKTITKDYTGGTLLDISTTQSVAEAVKSTGTPIAPGQKALVACNVSAATVTELSGATTIDAWKAIESNIDAALIAADTQYANTGTKHMSASLIPMFGSADVATATGVESYKVDVTVKHIVAKVTLNSLTMDVTGGDKFKVSRLFLVNVPEKFVWDYDAADNSFYAANTKFYQGHETNTGDDDTKLYRDYLSTATIDATVNKSTPLASKYCFYTMPNKANAAKDTRLVIAGYWTADGAAADNTTNETFYSLKLQNTGSPLTLGVKPNHHYVLDVIIKRNGGTDPYSDELSAAMSAAVNLTVSENWADQSNSNTFNEQGGAPE